jgi:predicted Rossmann-fold nucleotide-binding protein
MSVIKGLINHFKVKTLNLKRELRKKDHFRVAIFGSARIKEGDAIYQEVYDLAKKIGRHGYDVVTGGGPGLMEAANAGHMAGDKDSKADSIGLIIHLPFENKGNPHLEIRHRFKHFSTRLDTFLALSNVMVVTTGGIGSLLELYYMWQHLQVHHVEYKPIILIGHMWKDLIAWMKKDVLPSNLVSPEDFDYVYIAKDDDEAMEMIDTFHDLYEKEKHHLRKISCKDAVCKIPQKDSAKA